MHSCNEQMSCKKEMGCCEMLFEDKDGQLLLPEEVDELSPWEIEARKIHIAELYI